MPGGFQGTSIRLARNAWKIVFSFKCLTVNIMAGQPTPCKVPLRRNKALLRAYENPLVPLIRPAIKSFFLRGVH